MKVSNRTIQKIRDNKVLKFVVTRALVAFITVGLFFRGMRNPQEVLDIIDDNAE